MDWGNGGRAGLDSGTLHTADRPSSCTLPISFVDAAHVAQRLLTRDAARPGDGTDVPMPSGIGHPALPSNCKLCYTPPPPLRVLKAERTAAGKLYCTQAHRSWQRSVATTDLHTSFDDIHPARR